MQLKWGGLQFFVLAAAEVPCLRRNLPLHAGESARLGADVYGESRPEPVIPERLANGENAAELAVHAALPLFPCTASFRPVRPKENGDREAAVCNTILLSALLSYDSRLYLTTVDAVATSSSGSPSAIVAVQVISPLTLGV